MILAGSGRIEPQTQDEGPAPQAKAKAIRPMFFVSEGRHGSPISGPFRVILPH
jgi:hypothetical protein